MCAVPSNICTIGHSGILIVMLFSWFISGRENIWWLCLDLTNNITIIFLFMEWTNNCKCLVTKYD